MEATELVTETHPHFYVVILLHNSLLSFTIEYRLYIVGFDCLFKHLIKYI